MNEGLASGAEDLSAPTPAELEMEKLKRENLELLKRHADELDSKERNRYLEVNKRIDDLESEESRRQKQNYESQDGIAK